MPAAKGSARTPLGPKLPKIVATFVYASSQGQRTHSDRTKIKIGMVTLFLNPVHLIIVVYALIFLYITYMNIKLK